MIEDWVVVKVPISLVMAGVELPFIPVRESKRDDLSCSGEMNFEVAFEELRYFMRNNGDKMQSQTLEAYRSTAAVYAKLAINSQENSTNLERWLSWPTKRMNSPRNHRFNCFQVCALALQDDASGLGKIDTVPTRLIAAAHTCSTTGIKTKQRRCFGPTFLNSLKMKTSGVWC